MEKNINDLKVFLSGGYNLKPIVFIHGFPFDHLMWKDQIKEFSKNYLCASYDIRGLGESPAGGGQFTMEAFVDDLEKIVDELNLKKPVLCGLSMGGYISLRAMERFQNKFSALILCDTKSEADNNEGKLKRTAAIKQINSGKFDKFIETFVLNCFGEKFVKDKSAEYKKVVDRSKKNNPVGVKGSLLAMLGRTDTTTSLPKIKIATLVIGGSEDKLTSPDVMMSMAHKIPNAKFVLVKDAGHMTPIEQPEKVNKAIAEFLKDSNY